MEKGIIMCICQCFACLLNLDWDKIEKEEYY